MSLQQHSSSRAAPVVSGVMDTLRRALMPLLLFLAACAPALSENGRPCPCGEGWTCCEARNVCVNDARLCPVLPDSGPAAPSLRASAPASPTNATTVDVLGVAEARTVVELFTNHSCKAPAAGTGSVDAAGQFRVPIALVPNAVNRIWAHAVSVSGTLSQCVSYPLEIVQDSTPPDPPVLARLEPGGLSNSATRPELSGTAEIGSTVVLYAGAGCEQQLAFGAVVDVAGTFHVEARVDRNTVTVFAARAFDAAGNGSACSAQSFRFEHDDTPPAAPVFAGTTPASPGNSARPTIAASAEPLASVKLFASEGCTGEPIDARPAAADGVVSFEEAVLLNAVNSFSLVAVDAAGNPSPCSGAAQYVHDNIPPSAPPMAAFLPASPAKTLRPTIYGVVLDREPGEKLRLVRGGYPAAVEIAVRDVGTDGLYRVDVDVFPNTWTSFHGSTVDLAGNESAQVYLGSFYNDSIPPDPPVVASTSIPSPARSDTWFQVVGTGSAVGDRIDFWSDPQCTVPLQSSWLRWETQAGSASFHASLSVSAGGSTDVYATETDSSGNQSSCSADHVSFANRTTGPAWSGVWLAPSCALSGVMIDSGSMSCFGPSTTSGGTTTITVQTLAPGGTASATDAIGTVPSGNNIAPTALIPEGDALLAIWGVSTGTTTPGELHFAVRSPEGTWSADRVFSSHPAPVQWMWDMTTSPDRAGGAWAAWVTRSMTGTAVQELWVAHHGASGWSTPSRIDAATEMLNLRIAGGSSGHAVLAWEAITYGSTVQDDQRIAFYDPQTGAWGAPEVNPDGSYNAPLAIDDTGRALVTGRRFVSLDTTIPHDVLTTTVHHPDGTWDATVEHDLGATYLVTFRLQALGDGDAVLVWSGTFSGSGPEYLYTQRYAAASGWGPVDALGTVDDLQAMSLTADGSLWMLVTGVSPHLQLVEGVLSHPSWLLRNEPGTGWLRPQLVIDDATACYPSFCSPATAALLRNDAGTVLLPWRTSGPSGVRWQMRWYR